MYSTIIKFKTFLGTKGFIINYVRSNNNGTPIIGVTLSVNNTLALALGTYILLPSLLIIQPQLHHESTLI